MFKSLSTSLIARGILAVITGIIALAWPSVTVLALVILFAIYAFIAAGLQAARAFSSRTAGPVLGHLLPGLADLAAGVIALAWPGPTALVLVLIVGVWAIQREICGGSVQKRTLAWLRPAPARDRRATTDSPEGMRPDQPLQSAAACPPQRHPGTGQAHPARPPAAAAPPGSLMASGWDSPVRAARAVATSGRPART